MFCYELFCYKLLCYVIFHLLGSQASGTFIVPWQLAKPVSILSIYHTRASLTATFLGVRIGWKHPAIHDPLNNRFARLTSLVIWVAWHPTTSFQRPTVLEMVPPSEIHIHVNVYLSCEYIRQELLSDSDSLFTKFNYKEIVSNVFLTLTLPLNIALLSTL